MQGRAERKKADNMRAAHTAYLTAIFTRADDPAKLLERVLAQYEPPQQQSIDEITAHFEALEMAGFAITVEKIE